MSSSSTTTTTPPTVDTTPLLSSSHQITRSRSLTHSLSRNAARFITRSRSLREPSVRVRESAAEQIEERQTDWAYSKPVMVLDLIWNLAFVIVSVSVLIMSRGENPDFPLRIWIVGYAVQCVVHMGCVCVGYKRRNLEGRLRFSRNYSSEGSEYRNYVSDGQGSDYASTSVAKYLESANTMFSFILVDNWVLLGFALHFWRFDVFFVVICVAVACVIGVAVCCCLPCIIAVLYAVADQEGATKEDIERLPRYKFQKLGDVDKQSGEIQESFGGIMVECDTDSPSEHVLPLEDAECCICLCAYDDGEELRELPCRHHFHSACIDKWLHINSTCPLCKSNILKNGNQSGSEEA